VLDEAEAEEADGADAELLDADGGALEARARYDSSSQGVLPAPDAVS